MTSDQNPPAFPISNPEIAKNLIAIGEHPHGMSLRDYFAGQALVALGGHKAVTARGIPWLAEHAYMVADAMLAERSKTDGK